MNDLFNHNDTPHDKNNDKHKPKADKQDRYGKPDKQDGEAQKNGPHDEPSPKPNEKDKRDALPDLGEIEDSDRIKPSDTDKPVTEPQTEPSAKEKRYERDDKSKENVPWLPIDSPAHPKGPLPHIADNRRIDDTIAGMEKEKDEPTCILSNTVINGDITTTGKMLVYGTVYGNIIVNDQGKGRSIGNGSPAAELFSAKVKGGIQVQGDIVVGDGSVIVGSIKADSLILKGAFKGEIDVHGPVTLTSSAVFKGKMLASSVHIEDGAFVEGDIRMVYAGQSNTDDSMFKGIEPDKPIHTDAASRPHIEPSGNSLQPRPANMSMDKPKKEAIKNNGLREPTTPSSMSSQTEDLNF